MFCSENKTMEQKQIELIYYSTCVLTEVIYTYILEILSSRNKAWELECSHVTWLSKLVWVEVTSDFLVSAWWTTLSASSCHSIPLELSQLLCVHLLISSDMKNLFPPLFNIHCLYSLCVTWTSSLPIYLKSLLLTCGQESWIIHSCVLNVQTQNNLRGPH